MIGIDLLPKLGYEGPIEYGRFYAVFCPFHGDQHKSAYIVLRESGGGWFECRACHEKMSLLQLKERVGDLSEYTNREENYSLGNRNTTSSVTVTDPARILGIEKFIKEKGISLDTLREFNAEFQSDGYLKLNYGFNKSKVVYRKYIDEIEGPRFLNIKGQDKSLMGEEYVNRYKELILVEGITDFLSLWQAGKRNIVCSFGSKLSEEQAFILRDKIIFFVFDVDFAGYKGSSKGVDKLKEYGSVGIQFTLPEIDRQNNGQDKKDVNFLLTHYQGQLLEWLDKEIAKYRTTDDGYIEIASQLPDLREYRTNIDIFKFTPGLHALTGDEGVGKTTIAISIFDDLLNLQADAKGLYISQELPKLQILCRLASRYLPYSWQDLVRSKEKRSQIKELDNLREMEKRYKIVEYTTIQELVHLSEMFDIIMVDYLQVVGCDGFKDDRMKLEYITSQLARISQKGKLVIFISEKSNDGQPYKGTGRVKYALDSGFNITRSDDQGNLFVAHQKNRWGKPEAIVINVDYEHQRIRQVYYD